MKLLIKPAIVLGAIIGAILGIILLIPFVQIISCLGFTLIGGGIIVYLKRNNFIESLPIQDGALIGAISGFIAVISCCLVWIPLSFIINSIFSPLNKTGINFLTSFLTFGYTIFALIMIVFFVGLLGALFNAASALLVSYIYERIEINTIEKEENDILY